ncbi:T9SS type A sorting domain-containing protein [Lacinutrix iliipiscaria]|uniref:T9SS type A sorting domain-containing protein n=1 Tax=Lacinutrix iliipiscaria TaxID=1230532 RepID=A0ABW5WIB6_9FLAO
MTIYVFDMNNKLVHQTEFGAEDKYNFGQDLEGGVYIVKVVQGKDMKHVRLVKY